MRVLITGGAGFIGSHLVALGKQPVGEVRADEPGAAGDENTHGRA
jgi:nucleoside-diphosphate-sugar epimerase